MTQEITDMRRTIEFLKERGEVLVVEGEVDPIYEIAGIQKALENGPVLLFQNIKGYPGVRDIGNIFSREERVAALFDVADHKQLKFKCVSAMEDPIPPVTLADGPCQEVVIKDDIDVMATLPIIKHTEDDAGRIMGGGVIPGVKPWVPRGSDLSFKRMHFRGKDWASLHVIRSTHLGYAVKDHQGENIPLTVNIGVPPAVMLVAGALTLHPVLPHGADELGIAGALQGSPVELCKAKTVDAYAIANSEWVIEGYCTPDMVWECDEAERIGKERVAPFWPEWFGYVAKATRIQKFQVTGITHRRDRPIFFTPLAHSFEHENMAKPLREACFYELAERIEPGLVQDVNILHGIKINAGVVYKVKKRNKADDAFLKNIVEAALAVSWARLVVAVDEDVDIYSADEVLWAIVIMTNYDTGLIKAAPGAMGVSVVPAADVSRIKGGGFDIGGLGVDATRPFGLKDKFKRAHYPADQIDLRKWFTEEQIGAVRQQQCEYARLLARRGG
jgi:4-hydroxy-3-polyprenylbenzoate decarboxylase